MVGSSLIGLTGRARSGKDTVADFLVRECGYSRYAFAAPLKEMVAAMLGVRVADIEGAKDKSLKSIGVSPRRLLQTLGTEWGRETIDPNLWVNIVRSRIDGRAKRGLPTVISDVRFENEAAMIHDLGGIVVEIERPDTAHVEAHKSENGLAMESVDSIIRNDGSIDDLHRAVNRLLHRQPVSTA